MTKPSQSAGATSLRPRPRRALWACAAALLAGAPAAANMLMLGTYPDKLLMVDEQTGAVKERIQLDAGLPTSMRLSNDGRKVYVTTITTSGVVVLDAATRRILNQFSLNTPTTRYRFNGGVADPTGRYFYTQVLRMDKLTDRYVVHKPEYAVIDLAQKKIAREVEIDDQDDSIGGRPAFALSPDGKTFYIFKDKVLIVDTATLKVVDRLDMAKADTTGMEQLTFSGGLESMQNPNEFVSVFNAADPYVHNKVFGVGRFDLTRRTFQFTPMGPVPNQMSGLEVTPDGKDGYTVATSGSYGNKRCEFWHIDMASMQLDGKAEFHCRSRFTFGMSADGAKLYIYGASYDIEVYNAKTLQYERTMDLGADATMAGMLVLR